MGWGITEVGYHGGPVVLYYGGWGIMTGGVLWSGVLGGGVL